MCKLDSELRKQRGNICRVRTDSFILTARHSRHVNVIELPEHYVNVQSHPFALELQLGSNDARHEANREAAFDSLVRMHARHVCSKLRLENGVLLLRDVSQLVEAVNGLRTKILRRGDGVITEAVRCLLPSVVLVFNVDNLFLFGLLLLTKLR